MYKACHIRTSQVVYKWAMSRTTESTLCNTLQRTLQHTATHTATHCNAHCNTLQRTLQHTTTHTATHYNSAMHFCACHVRQSHGIHINETSIQNTNESWYEWVVIQCAAVCCSVLQCVAVCCSVLQCVAVCCSVLQCVAVCLYRKWVVIWRHCHTNESSTNASCHIWTIHHVTLMIESHVWLRHTYDWGTLTIRPHLWLCHAEESHQTIHRVMSHVHESSYERVINERVMSHVNDAFSLVTYDVSFHIWMSPRFEVRINCHVNESSYERIINWTIHQVSSATNGIATHCNTLQHMHCNTLQHTATHCISTERFFKSRRIWMSHKWMSHREVGWK